MAVVTTVEWRGMQSRRTAQLKLLRRTAAAILGDIKKHGPAYPDPEKITEVLALVETVAQRGSAVIETVLANLTDQATYQALLCSDEFRAQLNLYLDASSDLAYKRVRLPADELEGAFTNAFFDLRKQCVEASDQAAQRPLAEALWRMQLAQSQVQALISQSMALVNMDHMLFYAVGLQWVRNGDRLVILGDGQDEE